MRKDMIKVIKKETKRILEKIGWWELSGLGNLDFTNLLIFQELVGHPQYLGDILFQGLLK